MTFSSDTQSILHANGSYMAEMLLQRLKPFTWPFELKELPEGTVLVGGAIRDGLLERQAMTTDLDFVVPKQAILTCKKLAKKIWWKSY